MYKSVRFINKYSRLEGNSMLYFMKLLTAYVCISNTAGTSKTGKFHAVSVS